LKRYLTDVAAVPIAECGPLPFLLWVIEKFRRKHEHVPGRQLFAFKWKLPSQTADVIRDLSIRLFAKAISSFFVETPSHHSAP
jgi:hypothetical protein